MRRAQAWLLPLVIAGSLAGCANEPNAAAPAPTASQLSISIDRSLDDLEKMTPDQRNAARGSLDDLINGKGNPAQKERYAKLTTH